MFQFETQMGWKVELPIALDKKPLSMEGKKQNKICFIHSREEGKGKLKSTSDCMECLYTAL
jgi:hypothetical protein